jgi:hypothetical protein
LIDRVNQELSGIKPPSKRTSHSAVIFQNLSQLFSSGSQVKCFGTNRKWLPAMARISAGGALVLKSFQ